MKRRVVPFLKRPDTSSHGVTLGLCDSLHDAQESLRPSIEQPSELEVQSRVRKSSRQLLFRRVPLRGIFWATADAQGTGPRRFLSGLPVAPGPPRSSRARYPTSTDVTSASSAFSG